MSAVVRAQTVHLERYVNDTIFTYICKYLDKLEIMYND